MATYDFSLVFTLPGGESEAGQYLDALFEAGCDDALIGIGERGTIGLDFTREAESANEAIQSAVANVQEAIPDAVLLEASPDIVGVSDIAELVHCRRQNIQKYIASGAFPKPYHLGRSPMWHFLEVATWLAGKQLRTIQLSREVVEVSNLTYKLNLEVQKHRYDESQKNRVQMSAIS
ncbi:MAG: DNA-binding protein [Gammaproteobacteria bacterium]|nr:DNA-binding protein [Gammaproteobacteria bacterium]